MELDILRIAMEINIILLKCVAKGDDVDYKQYGYSPMGTPEVTETGFFI